MANTGESKLLSASDAAKILGVTPDTVRRWVKEKQLNAWIVGNGRHILSENEVERFRREREA